MKLVSRSLLGELSAKAQASPRARAHHNIHATPADLVQRFVVVAGADSYFRPHRHASRSELAIVVRGRFDVLVFEGDGRLTARYAVGDGTEVLAYETPQGTWHTLVPGAQGGAFIEVKQGPYDPVSAQEFPAWAPAEGSAAVPQFLAWLRRAQVGERAPG